MEDKLEVAGTSRPISTDFDYTGFNTVELFQVARVLGITNPSRCGNTSEGIDRTARMIVSHARAEYHKSGDFGYLGTMGWVVSTYPWPNGNGDNETRFKVTLEGWGIEQYLIALSKRGIIPKGNT